eukprot:COSAG06_NODE_29257_length_559_cov_25.032609_1_plen_172_part_01
MHQWDESMAIAMARASVNQWSAVATARKRDRTRSNVRAEAAAAAEAAESGTGGPGATMLPPGWTTTMWQGEIYYWNSITGQTSATPPEMGVKTTSAAKGQKQRAESMRSLSPREMWQQANEEVQEGALDAALEQRVRHREETRLDESMPFEDEGERSGEEGDEEMGHGTGLV